MKQKIIDKKWVLPGNPVNSRDGSGWLDLFSSV
jgi:hypothetical protein